ncbi:MAG: AmmeMemoRadiSam system radical SAM enzyme [Planctomycetota bacterium]
MNKKSFDRRQFLKLSAATGAAWGALSEIGPKLFSPNSLWPAEPEINSESQPCEVMFYQKLPDQKIKCETCPKFCVVAEGQRGCCGNKENQDGIYYNLAYRQVCALQTDPIEKKPFFHYLPGTQALSLATAGCNLHCAYCQNWDISQAKPENIPPEKLKILSPEQIIQSAQKQKISTIALTYSEPIVFYEYMYDIARLGRPQGINSIMISNGFINPEPLKELCQQLTAVKIDLKSFNDKFYREYCDGRLQPVLDTLINLKKIGLWFEIVVLLIPTLNDRREEIRSLCHWVKENLGPDVPVHFSRFYPHYKLTNLPPTPIKTIESAWETGRQAGLHYVYTGNVTPHPGESTYCPNCQKVVLKRAGYGIMENNLSDGNCKYCGQVIAGVWKEIPPSQKE